jgi:hypothetical protein
MPRCEVSASQVVFSTSPWHKIWLRTTAITILKVSDDSKSGLAASAGNLGYGETHKCQRDHWNLLPGFSNPISLCTPFQ